MVLDLPNSLECECDDCTGQFIVEKDSLDPTNRNENGVYCPYCGEPVPWNRLDLPESLIEDQPEPDPAEGRAEIEHEAELDRRRERHFDRHGHF